ncbi:sigma-54 interaction domain-containing protein [Bacillus infantis]|uniref:sigma-54 interaction domain-containing protein n=1 Tax=Bacillus infantis TaxID=324767 RepID=UPI003CE753F5
MNLEHIFQKTKLDQFINNLAVPAFLYNSKGRIVHQNKAGQVEEMTNIIEKIENLLLHGEKETKFEDGVIKVLNFGETALFLIIMDLGLENKPDFSYLYSPEVETILNTINDGIYISDDKGFTLLVNHKYSEMTGIKVEEVRGRHIAELVFDGYFDSSVTLEVLSKKAKVSVLQKTKEQEQVWLVNGNPVMDENGLISLIINSVYDMTALNQLRQNLKKQEQINSHQQKEINRLKSKVRDVPFLLGHSSQMKEVKRKISKLAEIDSTVLIIGETGSGKNVAARAIHELSSRCSEPFIEVNCGAIPEHLIESELFGYVEGSFTGAIRGGKKGLIESAQKGTIFLDEVGELPLALQVKLLTFLQDKKIRKIGGVSSTEIDVRVIAATNRKLEELVVERQFREDLYYRLSVVPVAMPPLRRINEDIEIFSEYFLQKYNSLYGKALSFNKNAYYYLRNYTWPGNVRELQHLIEQLVVLSEKEIIEGADLPEHIKFSTLHSKVKEQGLQQIMDDVEREIIINKWKEIQDLNQLAKSLQIHRTTLMRKLNKLNIHLT